MKKYKDQIWVSLEKNAWNSTLSIGRRPSISFSNSPSDLVAVFRISNLRFFIENELKNAISRF